MRKLGTGLMFAFGLSVVVAAQSASQSTNPSPSATPDAVGTAGQSTAQTSRGAAAGQTMTIVGCLQRGGGTATAGTTGAAGGATASATTGSGFILTNAARGESATTGAGGATTGAAGTTGAVASTYMLEGNASDLTPHVGHKIEVTGSARPAAAAGATTGAPGATDTGARANMAPPRFEVTSVKMIAAECGPAGR